MDNKHKHFDRTARSQSGRSLATFARTYPTEPIISLAPKQRSQYTTPTAHNAKEGAYPSEFARKTPTLAAQAGGLLNPTWVEWLMGWPLGWTDCGAPATDKFLQWCVSHGTC